MLFCVRICGSVLLDVHLGLLFGVLDVRTHVCVCMDLHVHVCLCVHGCNCVFLLVLGADWRLHVESRPDLLDAAACSREAIVCLGFFSIRDVPFLIPSFSKECLLLVLYFTRHCVCVFTAEN